jgi:hypothetical protein
MNVDEVRDKLGKPIEEEISPVIRALWEAGIKTTASCAGYVERALPYPWIDGEREFTDTMNSTLDQFYQTALST